MTDLRAAIMELCTELTACAHESQPPVAEAFAYAVEKLRELCAQYGWQPIESAPKGGSPIIVARIVDGRIYWVLDAKWTAPIGFYGICGTSVPTPTHWMPLPEVPRT